MTFDSAAHPRATDGTFTEKVGAAPEVEINEELWQHGGWRFPDRSDEVKVYRAIDREGRWHYVSASTREGAILLLGLSQGKPFDFFAIDSEYIGDRDDERTWCPSISVEEIMKRGGHPEAAYNKYGLDENNPFIRELMAQRLDADYLTEDELETWDAGYEEILRAEGVEILEPSADESLFDIDPDGDRAEAYAQISALLDLWGEDSPIGYLESYQWGIKKP